MPTDKAMREAAKIVGEFVCDCDDTGGCPPHTAMDDIAALIDEKDAEIREAKGMANTPAFLEMRMRIREQKEEIVKLRERRRCCENGYFLEEHDCCKGSPLEKQISDLKQNWKETTQERDAYLGHLREARKEIADLKAEIKAFREIDRHKDKDWGKWYGLYHAQYDKWKELEAQKEGYVTLTVEDFNAGQRLKAEYKKLKDETYAMHVDDSEECVAASERIKELEAEVTELSRKLSHYHNNPLQVKLGKAVEALRKCENEFSGISKVLEGHGMGNSAKEAAENANYLMQVIRSIAGGR